jgi:hypothetical protein
MVRGLVQWYVHENSSRDDAEACSIYPFHGFILQRVFIKNHTLIKTYSSICCVDFSLKNMTINYIYI